MGHTVDALGSPSAAESLGRVHPDYRPPNVHLYHLDDLDRYHVADDEEMTVASLGRVAAAVRELRVRQARESFPAFLEYAFRDEDSDPQNPVPVSIQWYQEVWSQAMDEYDRLVMVAPRGHAKTTTVVARVLWELGRQPNLRIKFIGPNDGRAMERLYEIKQHIEHNPRVHEVFPRLRKPPGGDAEWSKHKIIIERTAMHRDASVEAIGITTSATGGRADIVIADDVVDRRNALQMPAMREAVKQSWESDLMHLLAPNARVWYIATPWHRADLTHHLMKHDEYTVVFLAVGDGFQSIWPGRFPEDVLRRRYADSAIEYARAYRCQARDESEAPIRPDWFRFVPGAEVEIDPTETAIVCSYDTAVGLKQTNDYTAGVILGVRRNPSRIYVIDAWHDRLTLEDQAARIFADYQKFHPERILIEKVGQMVLDQHLLSKWPDLAGIVQTTTPKVGKFERLVSVTPLMQRGEVFFLDHLNPDDREAYRPGRGDLVGELTDFPIAAHDDLVDAYSQGCHWARRWFLDPWSPAAQNERDDDRLDLDDFYG